MSKPQSPRAAIAEMCGGVPDWWPRRMSKAEFMAELQARDLALSDLAFLWGISISAASRIAADPDRAPHWQLALAAVPVFSASQRKVLRAARKRYWPYVPPVSRAAGEQTTGQTTHAPLELEVGETVACHAYAGIAEEDDADGWIKAVRRDQGAVEYLVAFPAGEDWFDAASFDHHFYSTGRVLGADEQLARAAPLSW